MIKPRAKPAAKPPETAVDRGQASLREATRSSTRSLEGLRGKGTGKGVQAPTSPQFRPFSPMSPRLFLPGGDGSAQLALQNSLLTSTNKVLESEVQRLQECLQEGQSEAETFRNQNQWFEHRMMANSPESEPQAAERLSESQAAQLAELQKTVAASALLSTDPAKLAEVQAIAKSLEEVARESLNLVKRVCVSQQRVERCQEESDKFAQQLLE